MRAMLKFRTLEKPWFNFQKIHGSRVFLTRFKFCCLSMWIFGNGTGIKKKLLASLFIIGICCELGVSGNGWAQVSVSFPFTGSNLSLQPPFPRTVLPSEGFRLGPVQLRPSLGFAEVFTDNVFRDNTNRQRDFGHTIAPGIQAFLPIGERHEFLVDYRAAQQYFQRFPENDNFSHEAQGLLKLDYPGGLNLRFQGGQVRAFDPRGSILDIEQQDITRWTNNNFLGQAQYRGRHLGVKLSLSTQQWNFLNNDQGAPRDRWSNRASLTLYTKVTKKVKALLNVGIVDTKYDQNKQLDNFAYSLMTGFALPIADRLSGEFRIGITYLNFDRAPIPEDEEPPAGLSRGGETQERLSMRGNFTWNPTSRFNAFLQTFREIRQAGFLQNSTFVTTGYNMNVSYVLRSRTTLNASTFFSHNDFSGERSRIDKVFGSSVGLNYQAVKWLGFQLRYSYGQRFSSQPESEFYANNIMLSIQGVL